MMFTRLAVFTALICATLACTSGGGASGGGSATGGGTTSAGGGSSSSGGGSGGGSATDAGLPLLQACTVLNTRRCEALVRCGLLASTEAARRRCLAVMQSSWCGPSLWPSRVATSPPTLRYDGVQAQACAEALRTRACSDWQDLPPACARITTAAASTTQACYGDGECTDGVCRGAGCPRTCQAKGGLGEVCRTADDCRTGNYCRLANLATGVGQCVAYGQPMAACDSVERCAPGLACFEGKCVQPPLPGFSCLERLCTDDAFCALAADGGTCTPRLGPGASCTDDEQCQSGLLCEDVTRVCSSVRLSAPQSACGPRQVCPPGTACIGGGPTTTGMCRPAKQLDERCAQASECAPQFACFARDGGAAASCGPRAAAGDTCVDDVDCELYTVCRSGTCLGLPLVGESCALTQRCLVGPCVAASDAGSSCQTAFGPGIACKTAADCASAQCLAGRCLPSCGP